MPAPPDSPFTCLVLDDDFLALELVASFVEQIPSLTLAGTFEQPLAAFEHLARQPADLLITDIEMPGLSGQELVRALRRPPLVVFMTAHTHYAAGSYDLDAVDYLVKPLRFDRFLRAVDKALPLLRLRRAAELPAGPPPTLMPDEDFFFVRTELQFVKVPYAQVAYLEAMRDFTKIHLLNGTVHITLVNLKNMEDQLPPARFVRTHRSFLVNAAEIEALSGHEVQLRGVPTRLPLGGTFREAVTAQVVQRLVSRRPER